MDRLSFEPVEPREPEPEGEDTRCEDTRCEDCHAGKTGDRFTLAIKEGAAVFSCTICGSLPRWLEDADGAWMDMQPVPVSIAIETCSNPGGWHGLERCDCDFAIVITPLSADEKDN